MAALELKGIPALPTTLFLVSALSAVAYRCVTTLQFRVRCHVVDQALSRPVNFIFLSYRIPFGEWVIGRLSAYQPSSDNQNRTI